MTETILVRYGVVPEVARFANGTGHRFERGQRVVARTHRGLELGTILDQLKVTEESENPAVEVLRPATAEDEEQARMLTDECQREFDAWCGRIREWNLQLELIDLEWTLDREVPILYVLCERGPDSTNLALQAAARGFGIIQVQPISAEGLVALPTKANNSCGCGDAGGCSR